VRTLRRGAALAAVFICAATVAGCGTASSGPHSRGGPAQPRAVLTASQVSALRAYGTGDTEFGLNLLATLCRGQRGANVVLSPVSLATGLGMTTLGARGATAAAMIRVLHLPAGSGLVAGLSDRSALLRSLNRPGVTFTTSNRIWADPSLITNPAFVAALRTGYQAGLTHLPLLTRPEQARVRINSAVAADTRGHIKDLIPASAMSQPIGWVLTDALYLDAAWAHPFNHAMTQPGPFNTGTGTVTVKYMNGGSFTVAHAGGWTAAELPYRGRRLSMIAMLPPAQAGSDVTGQAAACQLPATGTVGALVAALAAGRTTSAIALPKIKLALSESLNSVLSSLGMGIAFSQRADFSGLSPQACCIGFVQHAATLAVAEKGTVASAGTAVGMLPTALRIELTFNRPYLLMIRDSLTGEPLMLAWVANPASS